MAALAEVFSQLRAVLDKSEEARDALNQAGDFLDEANRGIADTLAGSGDAEAGQTMALLNRACTTTAAVYRTLLEAEERVRAYLASIGGQSTPSAAFAPEIPPLERIEQLRAQLPPAVASGSGQKTHGRWIDADGRTHAEVSGKDAKYDEAINLFREMNARRIPLRASDVEMKLAAHMRNNSIRSATLVTNHLPCEGPLGCDALIPVILPEGYTLTVYGADDFVRVYQGGKTSSWLP